MSSSERGVIDWAAALADIEDRIAKLQATADGIREIMAASGASGGGPSGPRGGKDIQPNSFLKMSIPDATKKLLEMKQEKQSTQEVIDALHKGGLPKSKYNTLYSILARRQRQVGDIINMQGDWALKEWYPNYRPGKAKAAGENGVDEEKDEAAG